MSSGEVNIRFGLVMNGKIRLSRIYYVTGTVYKCGDNVLGKVKMSCGKVR